MLSNDSSSGLMTPVNTFSTRGISAGARVGTHLSFPTSVMAVLFLAMSGKGMTESLSTASSGGAVATMSRRNSMLNSTSSFLLREFPLQPLMLV